MKKITACRETLKFLQDLEFNMDASDITVQEVILFFSQYRKLYKYRI